MQFLVVYLNVICADFGDIFFLKVAFKLTPNTSLYIIIKITQMNKTIRINISKNGFFLGNERLNMLEYQFNEIRLRNNFYIVESDTSPDANCVICYDFMPEKTTFFSELDVWFTCDNKPLSENDYKRLAAFCDDYNPVFNGMFNRYKLCADINFCDYDFSDANRDVSAPVVRDELSSSMGISSVAQIAVPVGIDTISYNCQLSKNKETGLNRFHFVLDYKSFYTDDFLNSDVFKTQEALWNAVFSEDIEKVSSLLKQNINVNFCEGYKLGHPLDVAITKNNSCLCELLLLHGADVNSNTDGMTNLEQALYYRENNKEMIQLLAFCGGSIQTDTSIIYYSKAEDNYLVWLNPYIQLNLTENKEILINLLYLEIWKIISGC